MASLTARTASCGTFAFRSNVKPQTRAVLCRAASDADSLVDRRALLSAAVVGSSLIVPKAWALIPDEEDEELLERAKANRQKRIAAQKETTRTFLQEEGVTNRTLNAELVPVQKAVFQLAKSGSEIESGDLRAASSTLSGGWVGDFERATGQLDASDAEAASAKAILAGINSLKATTGKGDVKASKQEFVTLVAAVQDWAVSTGLSASLKGL